MFEVAHCFLCCWQETASGSGFGDDYFPFYKIQKSLNKCNLSTNVLFWSNCNIVHVSVVFYFECPFRVNASLSFAVKECNSLLSWIMSLIVVWFSIVIWSWPVANFLCCNILFEFLPNVSDCPRIVIFLVFESCQDVLGNFFARLTTSSNCFSVISIVFYAIVCWL